MPVAALQFMETHEEKARMRVDLCVRLLHSPFPEGR